LAQAFAGACSQYPSILPLFCISPIIAMMICKGVQCLFGVFVGLGLLLAWMIGLYLLDRAYRKRQAATEQACGIMTQSYAFALNLVRHFMPSFKVEKYQFRGMQQKGEEVNITFQDLSLELPSGVRVLQGVTGEFKAGRMCAIMGPSGAGKTTFMNVLCGKATYGKMAGSILINGKPANISQIKSVLGFVPQDDIVHQELTVREQIRFSAELRNKVSISKQRLELITDDVLNVMQMDHIQNSIVGGVEQRGISGGQRKRVNIGLELAAQPNVLFLDEPTSGLDATSSLAVVLSLKKMSQLGMTSIMVIHQPRYSLFTLFDDVLLLGKGGHTVYLGPAIVAKPYFESLGFQMPTDENPADWFMDVICGEVPNSQIPNFKASMLFEIWREKGDATLQQLLAEHARLFPDEQNFSFRGRQGGMGDDSMVLSRKLEEEWDKIDNNKDGVMDTEELKALLAQCSCMMPDDIVVQELLMRMAGRDAETVTKREFVDYLCGLKGDVAADRLLSALDGQGITGPHLRSETKMDLSLCDLEEGSEASEAVGGSSDSLDTLQRATPGAAPQMRLLVMRMLIQWWRKNQQRAMFLGVLAGGAAVLGSLDRFVQQTAQWDSAGFLNFQTALALLVAIFCLQIFGSDRPLFWRECSAGLNILAFYESRALINMFDLVIQSFLFTAIYFVITMPEQPFGDFWLPNIMVTWVASGWGYFISTVVPPHHGPFIASLVMFVICGLLGNPQSLPKYLDGSVLEVVVDAVSITRWSVEMSFRSMVEATEPHPEDPRQQASLQFQKDVYSHGQGEWSSSLGYWYLNIMVLASMGFVLRFLAYLGLRFTNRDKQV